MHHSPRPSQGYRCVYCSAALEWLDDAALRCGACEQRYPVIQGIPILAFRPSTLLAAHYQALQQASAQLEKRRAASGELREGHGGSGLVQRAQRALHGQEKNIELFQAYMRPVAAYLSGIGEQQLDFIDWISVDEAGCSPHAMLPYFYQDWSETADFQSARALITGALARHRPDAAAGAILGAGACGLVRACTELFDVTYGVDLSVPTLLLAQGALAGDEMVVHLERAAWSAVTLAPPRPSGKGAQLIIGDVNALPFADGSLSAVVTQYLMDIVGNPLGVASEIQRVLEPGGIWVNFSIPFGIPGEPPELGAPGLSELPGLLRPCGLEVVESERRRFTLLDFDKVYTGGNRVSHEVHLFVARKPAQAGEAGGGQPGERLARGDAAWWKRVPHVVPGREVQIIRKRVFAPTGVADRLEVGGNSTSFPVSADDVAFVEVFFGQIDGKRTVREIFGELTSYGVPLTEAQFRELMYILAERHGVLRLDDAR